MSIVIVGAGLAGAKTAQALRDRGHSGPVTLVGAEHDAPYERPPLSKGYLAGSKKRHSFDALPDGWYAEHDVDLRLGVTATGIDRAGRSVALSDGTSLGYEALVLATGSSPRVPPIPGVASALTLRNVADSEVLRLRLRPGTKLVVVGGGWIGLEVAAVARHREAHVTVLEAAELPLLGALGREVAQVFAELHREHGVDLRTGVNVERIAPDKVVLAGGATVPADVVLVAVGAAPNVALAAAAGLEVDNGVLVDAQLRTSDPAVFAVGDVANQQHPLLGRRVRVEHWANALNQPDVAAAAILGGDDVYDRLPYFFTDQYDLGMEYVGAPPPGGDARVVFTGDVAGREFVAYWLDPANRVTAAMNVNVWDVVEDHKELIASGQPVDPGRLGGR